MFIQNRCSVLLALVAGVALAGNAAATQVKNVIVLIPDGQSQSVQTLARWYRLWHGGAPLAVDEMGAGTMAANMVNSIVTDSAPGGTAMATGYKSTDKHISVGPTAEGALTTYRLPAGIPGKTEKEQWNWFAYRPLATVLEGAKRQGKATGVVATSEVTHATPAVFGAHVDSRSLEWDIAEQLVYQNIDVVFGGGQRRVNPATRPDKEDLRAVLHARGYQWVDSALDLGKLSKGKVWGLFSNAALLPDLDRRYGCAVDKLAQACNEPSLAEMTAKAIELLSKNKNGFFLFVEGSQVDWANHANDPAYALHDFLAFDDAVRVALEFAKSNPNTLVIAAPDHNTGGMSLGNRRSNWTYVDISVEKLLAPVNKMKTTAQFIASKLPKTPSPADIQKAVSDYWGIALTEQDAQDIIEYEKDPDVLGFGYSIAKIVSERYTLLGWTSHGHTGEDVPYWSYGPNAPVGHIDNTDFARIVAKALGLNLDLVDPQGLNQTLFVALTTDPAMTDLSDPNNPVLRIGSHLLQANKDFMLSGFAGVTVTCPLEGVVVYAPKANEGKGRWFAPRRALEAMANPRMYCHR